MFSGIIESVRPIKSSQISNGLIRIQIEKPAEFNDLKTGDSIAMNGVCLTLEGYTNELMTFALAVETIRVLGWDQTQDLVGKNVNLERSLRFGDRIHGHLVTGHVDSMGEVVGQDQVGESLLLDIKVSNGILPYIWEKGSVTVNGTSLTVNDIEDNVISLCLIPETQKRTNLSELILGDKVTIEPDYMAKALHRKMEVETCSIPQKN